MTTKIFQFIPSRRALPLTILLLFFTSVTSYAQQDDVLDYLPAIIAGAGGVCDPSSLDVLRANCTLLVDTDYDLNSRTITLPRGVKFDFNGGAIRNGTLVFDGGTIDGRLLNHQLTIQGNVKLKDPSFDFTPSKWGITQGVVSTPVATANKKRINQAIQLVHRLGGKVFKMDKMDAYFGVGETFVRVNEKRQSLKSILIPSNFDFRMASNTILRVQPNNSPAYHLMSIFEGENIRISGGRLFGDRWQHDYSPVNNEAGSPRNTHEWGHVMSIAGGVNILVENTYLAEGSGDAFIVRANSIRNADGTPGNAIISTNVTLRNSTLIRSRRNNMALTDGNDILIENNLITETGLGSGSERCDSDTSAGTCTSGGFEPRYGVDLEPFRKRTDAGELLEYERITNVVFRGNTFKNNFAGDIDLFVTSEVLIENNFFDGWIGNIASHDITIRNNQMKSRTVNPLSTGLLLHSDRRAPDGSVFNYNYTIHGNTIEGYSNAVSFAGESFSVFDNVLRGFKQGVGLGSLKNSTFENNKLDTNVADSVGYHTRGASIDNVVLTNESARVRRHPFRFTGLEALPATSNRHLKFVGGEFISIDGNASLIETSKNIEINGAALNTDVDIRDSENVVVIP